jgi:HAD superfamily hydrolase (TIGR01509 family)
MRKKIVKDAISRKKIKLIIFDLDGTLADAYLAITRSFNYVMRRFGYPPQDKMTIRRAVGWGDKNLLRPFIKNKDLRIMVSVYRRHHRTSLIRYSRLLPKAKAVLTHLKKRGYKLAVGSNRPTKFSWILIRRLGLGKYFDYVLCADRLKHGKPHPEILNKIMQRFSLGPKEVLYIGDMVIDVQAGRRAGVRTIMLTTGSSSRRELEKERSYRIISSIGDLLKVVS